MSNASKRLANGLCPNCMNKLKVWPFPTPGNPAADKAWCPQPTCQFLWERFGTNNEWAVPTGGYSQAEYDKLYDKLKKEQMKGTT